MGQNINALIEKFMTNAASLATEVFIAYDDRRIGANAFNRYMQAFDEIRNANMWLDEQQISASEFVDAIIHATVIVSTHNDIYFNSARDLYNEAITELSNALNLTDEDNE
jgi:hypothetical protein